MERGNAANPREDDQRKHETGGLVDGAPVNERRADHLQESVGLDSDPEPNPGRRPLTGEPAGDQPTPDQVARRRELSAALEPSWFPTGVAELRDRMETAPPVLWAALSRLDDGHQLGSMGELLDVVDEVSDP